VRIKVYPHKKGDKKTAKVVEELINSRLTDKDWEIAEYIALFGEPVPAGSRMDIIWRR